MKLTCVLVLALSSVTFAEDLLDNNGVRVMLKIYDDCSKAEGFSPCLKKKAITFLDRLGRMEKFSLSEGVTVLKAPGSTEAAPVITEDKIEKMLPRAADAQEEALNNMLVDKFTNLVGTRTLEISMPRFMNEDDDYEETEEGRMKGQGGKKKKKKGGMMQGLMMVLMAKMAAFIPMAIAGLFLLAGKALITAKIALLLSGIIAVKKLLSKKGGGHGQEHAIASPWQGGSGSGGGYQSSGAGGGSWDKRSLETAQSLAYNAQLTQ